MKKIERHGGTSISGQPFRPNFIDGREQDREFELDWHDPTKAPPNIAELTEKVIAALEEDMRREQAALVFTRLARRERPSHKKPLPAL